MPINYKNSWKTKITFGQHKNKSIEWLYENEKSYLDFILSQDFFKKFDYYSVFKNYKPPADHVKYCRDNGIKFCNYCCKKQRLRKTDIGGNFNYCGVCFNGDRSYARNYLLDDDSESGLRRKQEIKDKIDKKQLAEYKKSQRN